MNNTLQSIHRSVLSLPFDRNSASIAPRRRISPILSSRELRELVAEMVG
ncbi:MAG: hypothetical protein ABW039_12410 [Sphingobium sp.]